MKAILCTRFGGPEDLELRELPEPAPAADEAVVDVEAVGLNFFDTLLIAGRYQTKPPFPFSPGGEFAGTVTQVGRDVTGLAPGDRVAGYSGHGAARERIAVAAGRLVKLPSQIRFERASGLIITYGTALHALRGRAK